jgi:hypothetical protein
MVDARYGCYPRHRHDITQAVMLPRFARPLVVADQSPFSQEQQHGQVHDQGSEQLWIREELCSLHATTRRDIDGRTAGRLQ